MIDEHATPDGRRFIESHRNLPNPPEGSIFGTLIAGNFIPALATLSRLECIQAVGGYDEALFFEDWDMWLKLADRYHFSFLPEIRAQYRVVADSMAHSENSRPLMIETGCRVQERWIGHDIETDRVIEKSIFGIAEELYRSGHGFALRYARFSLQRDRSTRKLVMVLLQYLRAPYPVFHVIDQITLRAKRAVRRVRHARPEAAD